MQDKIWSPCFVQKKQNKKKRSDTQFPIMQLSNILEAKCKFKQ